MAGILAGALGGLGEAAIGAGRQLGDYASRSAIQAEQAEIQKMRDATLERYASEREVRQDLRADTRLEKTLGATASEGKLGREHSTGLATMTDTRIREEGTATREQQMKLAQMTNNRISAESKLGREQQLQMHNERMAEMKEQFKNQGLSIQSTTSGIVIVDAKNKTSTPILDAEGKPLKTLGQDDSFKVLGALGNLAKAAADAGDTATSKMYLDLAANVLKGKEGTGSGKSTPTPEDIEGLKKRSKDPGAVKFFESKYGAGSAATHLGGGLIATQVKAEDMGYSPTNAVQFKHVLENMGSQPSLKAQAKYWLESNALGLQQKQQIQRALSR